MIKCMNLLTARHGMTSSGCLALWLTVSLSELPLAVNEYQYSLLSNHKNPSIVLAKSLIKYCLVV